MISVKNRERHKSMIESPDDWPLWPKLPLVRRPYDPSRPDAGFMVPGRPKRVYLCNIYMIPTTARTYGDLDKQVPYKDYTDADAILDDGWVVD